MISMNKIRLFFPSALGCFLFLISISSNVESASQGFTLVYTGKTWGQVETCPS